MGSRASLVRELSRAGILFAMLELPVVAFSVNAEGRAVPGDDAFARMEYAHAAAVYDSLLLSDSSRADVLWRLARLNVCLGDTAPDDRKMDFYERAELLARRSIAVDSTSSEAHSWRAAALGSLAVNGGAKQKVQLAREIKRELDRAVACNPDDDVAHSILGSFYRAIGSVSWLERQLANIFLGGLPSGGYEDGEREFQIAIRLAPDALRHHFELGLLYLDWDRPDQALRAFSRAAELRPQMVSDRSRVERARDWVEKLHKGG